jgi:hypothetical protein
MKKKNPHRASAEIRADCQDMLTGAGYDARDGRNRRKCRTQRAALPDRQLQPATREDAAKLQRQRGIPQHGQTFVRSAARMDRPGRRA